MSCNRPKARQRQRHAARVIMKPPLAGRSGSGSSFLASRCRISSDSRASSRADDLFADLSSRLCAIIPLPKRSDGQFSLTRCSSFRSVRRYCVFRFCHFDDDDDDDDGGANSRMSLPDKLRDVSRTPLHVCRQNADTGILRGRRERRGGEKWRFYAG